MTSETMGHEHDSSAPFSFRLRQFAVRRVIELAGAVGVVLSIGLAAALVSYNSADPIGLGVSSADSSNLLGPLGNATARGLLWAFGISAAALPLALFSWSVQIVMFHRFTTFLASALFLIPGIFVGATVAALLTPPEVWPLHTGLGGYLGDVVAVRMLAAIALVPAIDTPLTVQAIGILLAGLAVLLVAISCGAGRRAITTFLLLGPKLLWALLVEAALLPKRVISTIELPEAPEISRPKFRLPRLNLLPNVNLNLPRPNLASLREKLAFRWPTPTPTEATVAAPQREPNVNIPLFGDEPDALPSQPPAAAESVATAPEPEQASFEALPKRRKTRKPKPAPAAPRRANGKYIPPSMNLLEAPHPSNAAPITREKIEEMSETLQSVLDDYRIGGVIRGARPGPAVTLFELDPPPGLKASRIEGLADDIARSMEVISARISTVPGSKMIGIEIPNHRRQPVLLSEIFGCAEFTDDRKVLPLALGKNILGDPVVADLETMPHLLVAGTTGSGKSVAINSMVLSLLYRLSPQDCRMIMIDPKMLEFKMYDDIPHLLTPVVTDPKTAVAALKWVVREMEERYQMMSRVGVRNITNFNVRAAKAIRSGQPLTRKVQTGFDPDSGQPVYEEVEVGVEHLPRIVVVVDEMADLMMVAGKEIESCVQRLAQMARASGIHLIMATQRPSVDVITGTIKANFPTRISFRLSSKIDSRTILNEQGAEKLLGQGDMLYQAAGSRVSRVHGPFVAEDEIEQIVAHLKSLGPPDYVPDVTTNIDEAMGSVMGGDSSSDDGDMLQRATEVIVRDQKASTSYLQRRLEIGYNRAARLMEQLEEAGVVSPANHAGRREILIGPPA